MPPSRTATALGGLFCRGGLVLAVVCVSYAGCGRSGPRRIAVEGTATFQGTPVEEALISFLPAKGRPGPAANAVVEDGQYRFSRQNGPTAGPHRVIVVAEHDDKSAFLATDNVDAAAASKLSGRWEFEVEVPEKGPFEYNVTLE